MQASGYTAAALGQARAPVQVSVILPVHDAEPWLDECLGSVLQQDFEGSMELSIFNDASKDKSMTIIEKWKEKLEGSGILVVIGGHDSPSPRGVGYSKNQAIAQSSGSYLCFLDSKIFLAVDYYFLHLQVVCPAPHPSWALVIPGSPQTRSLRTTLHSEAAELKDDDVMMPQRVRLQHAAAVRHPTSIIGCQVRREPPNSTERYTRWINHLAPDQLLTQVFTSNGPTVIMPTWFCSRAWFSHVGPFDEGGRGVPEDLLFFHEHLRKGGGLVRVDQSLLLYRYHPGAATHSILETTIWTHRVRFLEEWALPHWATFTIWNAGRQGRRLYRSLTAGSRCKVVAFCDVDENKIKKGFYCYEDSQERPKPRVPVLHFRAAQPPFVICVKLDLTGGAFEDNLRSLHLQEGRDFLHFS
ncbi:UDP-GlcNAc:betaGal beta-1,3-N-acetylglucosaminyltransferase-like protein 1 isoform X1 [Orcinus orca]|uniref:UDP-GlcNAc:betaGal beta-1,3-N-acetylglucosaminyltransferase-like protein 1 isoform X1 n=1 Tax=Orcinus orca TaxID=9733 RepID=UPI002113310F|nr:UDP-GlcNAc:betaGal beta-1,3-N-acetylglucosaminyltransferase-like protein 1 isoform X1 [Orcinus orca]